MFRPQYLVVSLLSRMYSYVNPSATISSAVSELTKACAEIRNHDCLEDNVASQQGPLAIDYCCTP